MIVTYRDYVLVFVITATFDKESSQSRREPELPSTTTTKKQSTKMRRPLSYIRGPI